MQTRIVRVGGTAREGSDSFGHWATHGMSAQESVQTSAVAKHFEETALERIKRWVVATDEDNGSNLTPLHEAATLLRESDHPVAFPTETVYGLGADATRSAAVRGIYATKGRPADNPLIVHVCDLDLLRKLLVPRPGTDPIPDIYRPLIARFWPGPLTILLPNPSHTAQTSRSPEDTPALTLAPEVTAGLPTFGARLPASPLARSLIQLAGCPLAAPSANASTRPSPTAAQHVLDDLAGRLELILDGGPCAVGVESTVVDGMCDPPVVLRPGGVSIGELRTVGRGWERVERAYRDESEKAEATPRAPGMKYKHYSPRARVVLYEAGGKMTVTEEDVRGVVGTKGCEYGQGRRRSTVAFIRTRSWQVGGGLPYAGLRSDHLAVSEGGANQASGATNSDLHGEGGKDCLCMVQEGKFLGPVGQLEARVLDISLGQDMCNIAQGLFSALRELDRRGADVIFVEGVSDGEGIAAAVMNRLRKAASDLR